MNLNTSLDKSSWLSNQTSLRHLLHDNHLTNSRRAIFTAVDAIPEILEKYQLLDNVLTINKL